MIPEKYCQREIIQSLFIETVSIKKMLLQRLFEDVVDTLVATMCLDLVAIQIFRVG